MNGAHLRTLLWLRWRLTRNQWRRGGELNAVITLIAAASGLGLGVVGGIGGLLLGALGLANASPLATTLLWDGLVAAFLFFWTAGVISELQRSEMIDATRLLHLPVSRRDVFLLNYLSSHLSFSLAMMAPLMLGLAAGLTLGREPSMALLVPSVLAFFFMVTAWTYCLHGWLAALMVNKRRRRAVVMGITAAFVLLLQLPNLLTSAWAGGRPPSNALTAAATQERAALHAAERARVVTTFERVNLYVPFLWLPHGAGALAGGNAWPVLWGSAGMLALGAWGLARAYRTTLRFYLGSAAAGAAAPPAAGREKASGPLFVERALPGVPEEAAALALANLRSISRAPEVKMALATNVVVFFILGAGMFLRRGGALPGPARPLMASAAVAATFLGMLHVMFNQFGYDRSGFRALVLTPAPRRRILLGKNLSLLPVALAVFLVYLGMLAALAHLPPAVLLASVLLFAAGFAALSALGNLTSICVPYRLAAGSLKPTKAKATTQLLLIAASLLFPLAMLPLFLPPLLGMLCDHFHWLPGTPVMLAGSAALAAAAALLYTLTLPPLGRLLQRREQKILDVVTQEVE